MAYLDVQGWIYLMRCEHLVALKLAVRDPVDGSYRPADGVGYTSMAKFSVINLEGEADVK